MRRVPGSQAVPFMPATVLFGLLTWAAVTLQRASAAAIIQSIPEGNVSIHRIQNPVLVFDEAVSIGTGDIRILASATNETVVYSISSLQACNATVDAQSSNASNASNTTSQLASNVSNASNTTSQMASTVSNTTSQTAACVEVLSSGRALALHPWGLDNTSWMQPGTSYTLELDAGVVGSESIAMPLFTALTTPYSGPAVLGAASSVASVSSSEVMLIFDQPVSLTNPETLHIRQRSGATSALQFLRAELEGGLISTEQRLLLFFNASVQAGSGNLSLVVMDGEVNRTAELPISQAEFLDTVASFKLSQDMYVPSNGTLRVLFPTSVVLGVDLQALPEAVNLTVSPLETQPRLVHASLREFACIPAQLGVVPLQFHSSLAVSRITRRTIRIQECNISCSDANATETRLLWSGVAASVLSLQASLTSFSLNLQDAGIVSRLRPQMHYEVFFDDAVLEVGDPGSCSGAADAEALLGHSNTTCADQMEIAETCTVSCSSGESPVGQFTCTAEGLVGMALCTPQDDTDIVSQDMMVVSSTLEVDPQGSSLSGSSRAPLRAGLAAAFGIEEPYVLNVQVASPSGSANRRLQSATTEEVKFAIAVPDGRSNSEFVAAAEALGEEGSSANAAFRTTLSDDHGLELTVVSAQAPATTWQEVVVSSSTNVPVDVWTVPADVQTSSTSTSSSSITTASTMTTITTSSTMTTTTTVSTTEDAGLDLDDTGSISDTYSEYLLPSQGPSLLPIGPSVGPESTTGVTTTTVVSTSCQGEGCDRDVKFFASAAASSSDLSTAPVGDGLEDQEAHSSSYLEYRGPSQGPTEGPSVGPDPSTGPEGDPDSEENLDEGPTNEEGPDDPARRLTASQTLHSGSFSEPFTVCGTASSFEEDEAILQLLSPLLLHEHETEYTAVIPSNSVADIDGVEQTLDQQQEIVILADNGTLEIGEAFFPVGVGTEWSTLALRFPQRVRMPSSRLGTAWNASAVFARVGDLDVYFTDAVVVGNLVYLLRDGAWPLGTSAITLEPGVLTAESTGQIIALPASTVAEVVDPYTTTTTSPAATLGTCNLGSSRSAGVSLACSSIVPHGTTCEAICASGHTSLGFFTCRDSQVLGLSQCIEDSQIQSLTITTVTKLAQTLLLEISSSMPAATLRDAAQRSLMAMFGVAAGSVQVVELANLQRRLTASAMPMSLQLLQSTQLREYPRGRRLQAVQPGTVDIYYEVVLPEGSSQPQTAQNTASGLAVVGSTESTEFAEAIEQVTGVPVTVTGGDTAVVFPDEVAYDQDGFVVDFSLYSTVQRPGTSSSYTDEDDDRQQVLFLGGMVGAGLSIVFLSVLSAYLLCIRPRLGYGVSLTTAAQRSPPDPMELRV